MTYKIQNITLTTGVDVTGVLKSVDGTTSTANNDTFNAILGTGATLNIFDNIDAGAGTDTLNLIDSTAAAFAVPAGATLAGFETVFVNRSAPAAATSIGVTVTDSTFGTGVKTLNIVESGLATTAAAASVTLNSAETVAVISTGATKFNGVTVADTTAVAATTGSTLKTVTIQGGSTTANAIWGNAVTTVNLNDTGAVATVVNAAAGTRAVTVNTTGTAAVGGFTDAQATTLNINSNGTAAMALGTFTAAKATTVNYASSVIANTSLTLTAAAATTLNVSGSKVATMTMAGNTALATVNVTGSAGLTTDLTAGATAVTLLDTTGTTGKSTVTLNTNTAVNGGAGADFITVANTQRAVNLGAGNDQATVTVTALAAGGSINGGDGIDELVLTNADAVTLSTADATQTAFKAAVTGFEVLNIGTQSGSTVSATGAGTFTTVKMTSAAAAQVLSNVSSGQTIESTFGAAGTSVTTNILTGGADSLTVKLSGDLSAAGRSFGTFATPGVETVNIVTADTATTFAAKAALVTLTNANAATINISGNNGLNLVHTGTALFNFDASGLTKGAVNFTSAILTTDSVVKGSATGGDYLNFAAATAKVNATTTAGTNMVVGSATQANTLSGGSGADTIFGGAGADVINGGAGDDVIFADAITAAGEIQTITYATANATVNATVTVGGVVIAIGRQHPGQRLGLRPDQHVYRHRGAAGPRR
jgi:S-layer protein